jgi:hypothetical protein
LPEACWFDSYCHIQSGDGSIMLCFGFGRQDVAVRFKQGLLVEPVHPFKHGIFDGFGGSPRSVIIDHRGHSIIVAVAKSANQGLNPNLGETFAKSDGDIAAAIGVMDEIATAPGGRS